MDRKTDEYVRLSESAASEIAKWPQWMQRNLKPLKTTVSNGKSASHPRGHRAADTPSR
jgi:hypothetical protein